LAAHRRGDVEHLDALLLEADLLEQLANILDPAASVEITRLVMTIALQSAGHHHSIGAVLERV
jgi:hypothetical protein